MNAISCLLLIETNILRDVNYFAESVHPAICNMRKK